MTSALVFIVSCALSAGVITFMLRTGRVGAIDTPNDRSLHQAPIPRSGGLGILAAMGLGVILSGAWALALMVATLALISWLDDHHNLPAALRLVVHILVAGALAFLDMLPAWNTALMILMVMGVVWLTNLYNFMDGANGLAGGMALIGFSALGIASAEHPHAALMWALAGGALGFLLFNFHPARIFMGDIGSIPLGFLAGASGLIGIRQGLWTAPFMLLVFSPFIVDATVTLVKRGLRGEKVWRAHREHYYQRLIQSGWSHRRTVLCYYAIMLVAGGHALILRQASPAQWALALAIWAGVYGTLALMIERHWARYLTTGSR